MASKNKRLRSGYTTGACAAAAAKAAALFLFGEWDNTCEDVEIPFPDGARHSIRIESVRPGGEAGVAWASVKKDAGDDPDVTDGIELRVRVTFVDGEDNDLSFKGGEPSILIKGGQGVGIVTRPGLSVAIGEPAINPIPRRMIGEAIREAIGKATVPRGAALSSIEIVISVPEGELRARKTLNSRLGIEGGISILGTTGIVRPISSEAWTAAISTSMSVARAMGREEVVLFLGQKLGAGPYGVLRFS